MHGKITGLLAEKKLDEMIEVTIKAGIRLYSRKDIDPLTSEAAAEIVEQLQVVYEDLSFWDILNAFRSLASYGGPEHPDYIELFLQEINREVAGV